MSFFKSLFGNTEWDSVDQDITDLIKRELGEEKFVSFTSLCNKYNVFDQLSKASSKFVDGLPERPLESRLISSVSFFTNVGNELGSKGLKQDRPELTRDGIEFSKIALILKPDHWPAHCDLAASYMITGEIQAAQREAKQTILYMEKESANEGLDLDVNMLNAMKEIAAGRMPQ